MNKILNIVFTLFVMLIGFGACKKTNISSFAKDAISLKKDLVNTSNITWDKVNTSDFKKYEIFASGKSSIDITSPKNLIATISDMDINTFDISSIFIDSLPAGGKIYFKVAAVLSERKIGSNTINETGSIIFSSNLYTYINTIPELNKIILYNGTLGKYVSFDPETGVISSLQNNLFGFNGEVIYGKNENGQIRIINYSGGVINICNLETNTIERSFNISGNQLYSYALVNGFLILHTYSSASNQFIVEVRRCTDFSLISTFSLMAGNSVRFLPSGDNTRFVAIPNSNFDYGQLFSINSSGDVASLGASTVNSFSGSPFAINQNGTMMIIGNQGAIYNSSMQLISNLGASSSSTNFTFSQNDNLIAASESNIIAVYDANSLQKIKTINFNNLNSTFQIFGATPKYIKNQLYVVAQAFSNISSTQSLLILKK
jgi:hypothetical protein